MCDNSSLDLVSRRFETGGTLVPMRRSVSVTLNRVYGSIAYLVFQEELPLFRLRVGFPHDYIAKIFWDSFGTRKYMRMERVIEEFFQLNNSLV